MGYFFHHNKAPKTKLTVKYQNKIWVYFQAHRNLYPPKKWESMRFFFEKSKKSKKKVSVLEKKSGSDTDTEIGPWFRFLIPKPGFCRTLIANRFM